MCISRISLLLFFLFIHKGFSLSQPTETSNQKMKFWDEQPRRGCNCFNEVPSEQWFKDAASVNIEWVRLAYDKWDTEKRDFLLGDASDYNGLVQKDLEKLKEVLSWAEKYGLKVVIVPLSLPGCRWRQNNEDKIDSRLWEDFSYHEKAAQFWQDMAKELKGYSCIVAYDILNEPFPEWKTKIDEQAGVGDADRFLDWCEKYRDTARDLFQFTRRMVRAIREYDSHTPIMVESGMYDQPSAFMAWPGKLEDEKILYSFHIYEPYSFTSPGNFRNGGKYLYPGEIPFGNGVVFWDINTIKKYFEPFYRWTEKNSIPANRIVAAEFGCMRRNTGAAQYLADVIQILEERNYHWAFYSFREDGWDGYDYELGSDNLPAGYWKAKERGEKPELQRKDNPIFDVIKKQLEKQ